MAGVITLDSTYFQLHIAPLFESFVGPRGLSFLHGLAAALSIRGTEGHVSAYSGDDRPLKVVENGWWWR